MTHQLLDAVHTRACTGIKKIYALTYTTFIFPLILILGQLNPVNNLFHLLKTHFNIIRTRLVFFQLLSSLQIYKLHFAFTGKS